MPLTTMTAGGVARASEVNANWALCVLTDTTVPITVAQNFAAGTEALPSIYLNGDTNTGIYQPAADEIAFSTAGTQVAKFAAAAVVLTGTITQAGSKTAASGVARTFQINTTLVAAADNDELTALRIAPTFTEGGFTGLTKNALVVVTGATSLQALTATTGSFSSTLAVTGATSLQGLTATTGSFSSAVGVTGVLTVGTAPPTNSVAGVSARIGGSNKAVNSGTGNLYVHSTDAAASDLGGSIVLGGKTGATTDYSFASIHGKKEAGAIYKGYFVISVTADDAGNHTERLRIASGGQVLIGTTVTTGASAGDVVLANSKYLRSVNPAGTSTIPLIGHDGYAGRLVLGDSTMTVHIGGSLQPSGANAGDLILGNAKAIRGVNAAGTSTLAMIYIDAANALNLDTQGNPMTLRNGLYTASAGALSKYWRIYDPNANAYFKVALYAD